MVANRPIAKANKKVDPTRLPCPAASKIIEEMLQRHILRHALIASASFVVDEEKVTFSVNNLRTVLKLPQVTDNDHAEFVEASKLVTMIKFLNILGHGVVIRLAGQSYTKDLPQPWQTLCKLLSHCLTSRITLIDQPPLAIMQNFYATINNIHVDYAALI
ncbi:hypothetical protein Tco_0994027 [Tanacetum coccineum]